MTLIRYALTLALGVSSVGIASGQESFPTNLDQDSAMTVLDRYDQTSDQIFATLTGRTRLFEAKAQLATQCAKGLRLIEKVMKLTEPDEEDGEAEWTRETSFLVRTWLSEEQRNEWYFAGKEFVADLDTYLEGRPTKAEAMVKYKSGFALIMNTQIAVLERISHDLDARLNRLKDPRSAD